MNEFAKSLLRWYKKTRILYPWRQTNDPYRIWLSEILLQQTRIPVALKFYESILKKYPSVEDLVQANETEFFSLWSGAGYYSRAKNMLRCAKQIVSDHGGKFPIEYKRLLSLPGIGKYTAGAIRNVCFEELTPAIDGNTGRVLARITNTVFRIDSNEYNSRVSDAYKALGAGAKPSVFFQSLMELGEQVCLPKPRCEICPVDRHCLARLRKTATRIPVRRQKRAAENYYWYLLILKGADDYYYVQNPRRDFLKDAWIFPDILSKRRLSAEKVQHEFRKTWKIDFSGAQSITALRHAVTFRRIAVEAFLADKYKIHDPNGKWLKRADFTSHPTSSVIQKLLLALTASNQES